MRCRARGHVPIVIEAWNTGLVERDVGGTDLPRYIARDTKSGVGVPAQAYTKIIDVVNHCPGIAHPSKYVLHTNDYLELGNIRGGDCARGDSSNVYGCLEVGIDVDRARSIAE